MYSDDFNVQDSILNSEWTEKLTEIPQETKQKFQREESLFMIFVCFKSAKLRFILLSYQCQELNSVKKLYSDHVLRNHIENISPDEISNDSVAVLFDETEKTLKKLLTERVNLKDSFAKKLCNSRIQLQTDCKEPVCY